MIAADPDRVRDDHAAERRNRHLARAAADVDDHRADGLRDRKLGTDRRGERLLDQVGARGAGVDRRLLDGGALDLGNTARDADHHVRAPTPAGRRLADEVTQHLLRRLEVRDHAVAKRARRADVRRRAADHASGVLAERLHVAGSLVDRDHRRLEDDDPAAALVDDRVGGTQVDREAAVGQVLATPQPHAAGGYLATRVRHDLIAVDGRPVPTP
jgi:hypothetical protein